MIRCISGRPMDDLDTVRLRVLARQLAGPDVTFSVTTAAGRPITGFIAAKPQGPDQHYFTERYYDPDRPAQG